MTTRAERLRAMVQQEPTGGAAAPVTPAPAATSAATSAQRPSKAAALRSLADEVRMPDRGSIGGLSSFGRQYISGLDDPLMGAVTIPGAAEEDPTTLLGSAGRLAGQTTAIAPAVGLAASALPAVAPAAAGASLLTRFSRAAARLPKQLGTSFRQRPIATTGLETGLGATAGTGGFLASQTFPDSDGAKFVGEIIGGTAPALLPINIAVSGAKRLRYLTGEKRAKERLLRTVPEKDRALLRSKLDEQTLTAPSLEEFAGGTPREAPVLTPAQRIGDPDLLALERSIVESSDQLKRQSDEQIANANAAIQQASLQIGGGDTLIAEPGVAIGAAISEKQQYLLNLMDTRMRIAAQKADERIIELGPTNSREATNHIVAEELEAAMGAARTQENELYELIPQATLVKPTAATAAFLNLRKETSQALQGEIPRIAKKFLNPKSKQYLAGITEETTIKELRGLQRKLNESAQISRAAGKFTRARFAQEISNAITEDIANNLGGPEVSEAVETAVEFSRQLNNRFTRGTVGRLLNNSSKGGLSVPASLSLERSLGAAGPRARQAFDDLIRAFDSPEAPSSETMLSAANDYVKSAFLRETVERGKLNVVKARRYLLRNEELLKRMPRLRQQFEDAIATESSVAIHRGRAAGWKFDSPRTSKTTLYLREGPVEIFNRLSKLTSSSEAGKEARLLIRAASRDETGEALQGLKAGFIEFLHTRSRTNVFDSAGRPVLSGRTITELYNTPSVRAIAARVLTGSEQKRFASVASHMRKLEKRIEAGLPVEGAAGKKMSKAIETVAGLAGASVGRSYGQYLGLRNTVQGPGLMANLFRRMADAGIRNPARRLLTDAVFDEKLYRELLLSNISREGMLSKSAVRRLNAWAIAAGADYGVSISAEQQPKSAPQRRDRTAFGAGPEVEDASRFR